MDPQVRDCTTSDGLSIGYWSIGGGETDIDAGQAPTHCEMEWRLAPMRRWYERFAVHHRFVRFDMGAAGCPPVTWQTSLSTPWCATSRRWWRLCASNVSP